MRARELLQALEDVIGKCDEDLEVFVRLPVVYVETSDVIMYVRPLHNLDVDSDGRLFIHAD